MLKTITDLRGYAVYATDGRAGELGDVHFDDRSWDVRHLVVRVGGPLSCREVLVAPGLVEGTDAGSRTGSRTIGLALGLEEVEGLPGIETELPVAARREADYHARHGERYRFGSMLPDGHTNAFPIDPEPVGDDASDGASRGDENLRSAGEVLGYGIRSMDGGIGHVEDLLVDAGAWAVRYVVVDTRNWLPGRKVLVAATWVSRVDWEKGEVAVDLGSVEIKEAPIWNQYVPLDREYETRLHSHYGRPPYWIYER